MPAGKRAPIWHTRRRRGSAATFERILTHALELFAAHGYEGVSLNDVARAADLRKATLFYYFASKAELYAAIAEAVSARFVPFAERLATEPPSAEGFVSLLEHLHDTLAAAPEQAVLLVREAIDRKAKGVNLAFEPLVALGERYIRAGQRARVFSRELSPRAAIDAIVGALTLFFLGPDTFLGQGQPLTLAAVTAHRDGAIAFCARALLERHPEPTRTRRRS